MLSPTSYRLLLIFAVISGCSTAQKESTTEGAGDTSQTSQVINNQSTPEKSVVLVSEVLELDSVLSIIDSTSFFAALYPEDSLEFLTEENATQNVSYRQTRWSSLVTQISLTRASVPLMKVNSSCELNKGVIIIEKTVPSGQKAFEYRFVSLNEANKILSVSTNFYESDDKGEVTFVPGFSTDSLCHVIAIQDDFYDNADICGGYLNFFAMSSDKEVLPILELANRLGSVSGGQEEPHEECACETYSLLSSSTKKMYNVAVKRETYDFDFDRKGLRDSTTIVCRWDGERYDCGD